MGPVGFFAGSEPCFRVGDRIVLRGAVTLDIVRPGHPVVGQERLCALRIVKRANVNVFHILPLD